LRGRQVFRLCGCLGDFVPIILDRSVPKAPRQRLVCGRVGAARHSERFDFIERLRVRVTGQSGRRTRTKLARLL
jgi:hypothetical protein